VSDVAAKTAARPLTVLEQQITDALAELRGARLDYDHCPSTDNERTVLYAERRLDRLTDRLTAGS
jgi:hypothetical protein